MDHNELLGIKSLAVSNKKQLVERFKDLFALNWIFDKWYEKLILVILMLMGFWKLIEFI